MTESDNCGVKRQAISNSTYVFVKTFEYLNNVYVEWFLIIMHQKGFFNNFTLKREAAE